jgi:hypothetical protein
LRTPAAAAIISGKAEKMAKRKKKRRVKGPGETAPEGRSFKTTIPGENLRRGYQVLIAVGLVLTAICVMYPELVFENKVFLSGDFEAAASLATPIQKAMAETGGYPLWNPYLFSGMPSYGSLSYNPYVYPVSVLTGFLTDKLGFPNTTWLLFHAFLLGLGVFLLLWDRGVNFLVSACAGILMMWSPHDIAVGAYGHGTQANAVAYIPYALLFWDRIWRGKRLVTNAAALVIVLGFQLLRAHIQIAYYTFALLGLHTIFFGALKIRASRRGKPDSEYPTVLGFFRRALRREHVAPRRLAFIETTDLVVVFGLVVVGALLVSAVLFLPVKDYSGYSIRGASESGGLEYGYATSWSLHPLESLTFIIPFSFGFGKILYHGHMPFTDYPNYVGLVVVIFSVFAVVLARSRFVWFLVFVIVVTTLVSFGKHFPLLYNPLFKFLPYFNKFRVPVMVLIVQQLAFVILFALGLSAVLKSDPDSTKKSVLWGLGGALVLLVVCVLGASFWTGGYARGVANKITAVRSAPEQLQLARLAGAFLFKDLVKTSLLLGAVFGFIGLYARRTIPAGVFVLLVGLAALGDMYLVDRYVLHPEHLYPKGLGASDQFSIMKDKAVRDRFLEPDAVIDFLREHAAKDSIAVAASTSGLGALYRVFPVFHPSAPFARGDFGTNRFMNFGISSVGGYHPAKLAIYADFIKVLESSMQKSNYNLLDIMNARYVVTSYPFPGIPYFEPVWEGTDYDGQKHYVYVNTRALPRLFFVDRYRALEPSEILALLPTLPANGVDLAETVLLEQEPDVTPVSKEGARAVITHYSLNEIRVEATLASPAILVLSEVFYPRWMVTVDGKKGKILKADYVLRAVALDAGSHEIVFRYDDSLLKRGLTISLSAFALVLVVLAVSSIGTLRGSLSWKR